METMRPGFKTSEFWLTLVAALLSTLKGVLPDFPSEGIYAVIVYVLSRTVVKATAALKAK